MKKINKNSFSFSVLKKMGAGLLTAALVGTTFTGLMPIAATQASAASTDYGLADTSQHGVILHCWNWSYNNIKKYMKDIAAAGYTSVQTSPVQQPKDYYWKGVAYGNVGIPNGCGGEDGNWWKAYQPVTFSICDNGYTWYGTKAEFKAMCDEAEKYGVKVIVDIVANHMGNIQGYKIGDEETVMGDISPQVGEFWKPEMLTDPSYWHISTSWTHSSDGRFDVTQGNMGMPDLNTGDSRVQQMVLGLLKECIDCGADGFRFDAAKHIETPADDPAFASNFWNVVLDGARSYYKSVNGYDGVYFYGEVLNRIDDSNAEAYYRSKMSITDNSTSDNLRNSVINGQVGALASSGYCSYIGGQGDKCVLWAESHDTYMGGGSSYDANDADIMRTWAIISSRKDSTGLFFARPFYSKDILAGDVSKARQSTKTILENIDQTQLGDVGTLTWANKEVVECNRFRNYFVGQSEKLGSSGNTAYNLRGNTGIVIVRGDGAGAVSLSVGMKDGTYTDQVGGGKFTVSGGTISGNIANKNGIAVIYNPSVDYGDVNPVEPTIIKIKATTEDDSTVFSTDTKNVTMSIEGAVSAEYETSEGDSGSFTSSKTITIGSKTEAGNDITVTINATASDGTKKSKTYAFTKKGARTGYPTLNSGGVVFDNESFGWPKVYCYVYENESSNNGAWPGVAMTEEDGNYFSYEFPDKFTGTVYVIFSNGSGVQYPGSGAAGLRMLASEKKLFVSNALEDLPDNPVKKLSVKLSASPTSVELGKSVVLTATATDNTGDVSYTFTTSDGTVIKSASSSSTCSWTPSAVGNYTVKVSATDDSSTATATTTVSVTKPDDEELVNNSTISSTSININDSVTITNKASGGSGSYSYKTEYKLSSDSAYTTLQAYSTAASSVFKPTAAGTYTVRSTVKDSDGKTVTKTFTVKVKDVTSTLVNNSSVSDTEITLGNSVKVTMKATGGTAPYQYGVYYKKASSTTWSTAQSYGTTTSVSIKPAAAVKYDICVKVKDSKNTIVKKYYTLNVTKKSTALTNTSKISATAITLGNSVKVTMSATGGTAPYKYGVYYKKATSTTWSTAQSYGTTTSVSIKPAAAVDYDICVKVKDSKNTIVKKYFTLSVTKTGEFTNASKISATTIELGDSVKLTMSSSGGSGTIKYGVYMKEAGETSWTTVQSYSTATTKTITPSFSSTSYDICVKARDDAGKIAKKYFTVKVK